MTSTTDDPGDSASIPAKEGLKETADFVRLSSGLVTAILGASFVFFSGNAPSGAARTWIFTAWILLLVSALASLVVYALLPPKFSDRDYSLKDNFLNVAGLSHLFFFFCGLIALAVGVGIATGEKETIASAQDAIGKSGVDFARQLLDISKVELIKGPEDLGDVSNTWHIQVKHETCGAPEHADIFIDAKTGKVSYVNLPIRRASNSNGRGCPCRAKYHCPTG